MSEVKTVPRFPKWLIITIILVFAPIILWQVFVYKHHIDFVPKDLGVWRVLYSKEKVWGLGPGGNETGVIVYDLPQSSAELIKTQGIEYLSTLPSVRKGKSWQGIYSTWNATPISKKHKNWFEIPTTDDLTDEPQLENYLNKYGFGIPVKQSVEEQINEAMSTPGSFFAYGRIGIIIIAPQIHRVFYVYVG